MNFRFFNHRLFSALLNFIGLTLAFSAFLVIMVPRNHGAGRV